MCLVREGAAGKGRRAEHSTGRAAGSSTPSRQFCAGLRPAPRRRVLVHQQLARALNRRRDATGSGSCAALCVLFEGCQRCWHAAEGGLLHHVEDGSDRVFVESEALGIRRQHPPRLRDLRCSGVHRSETERPPDRLHAASKPWLMNANSRPGAAITTRQRVSHAEPFISFVPVNHSRSSSYLPPVHTGLHCAILDTSATIS